MTYDNEEGRIRAILSFIQEYPEPNRKLPLNVKTIIDYISGFFNDLQYDYLRSTNDDVIIEHVDQNSNIFDIINLIVRIDENGYVIPKDQSDILFSFGYLLDKIFDNPIGKYIKIDLSTTVYDLSRLIIEVHHDYFEE